MILYRCYFLQLQAKEMHEDLILSDIDLLQLALFLLISQRKIAQNDRIKNFCEKFYGHPTYLNYCLKKIVNTTCGLPTVAHHIFVAFMQLVL